MTVQYGRGCNCIKKKPGRRRNLTSENAEKILGSICMRIKLMTFRVLDIVWML